MLHPGGTGQRAAAEDGRAGSALAKLVDTNRRNAVAALVERCEQDAYSRYARGYLALTRGETDEAIRQFVAAQSMVAPDADQLAARLCLELGCVFVGLGRAKTAEAILEWGAGTAGRDAADVAHLRALLADVRGDYRSARIDYKTAIRNWRTALSPATYALALSNLAVALAHEQPAEAVELALLSLRTIVAEDLHTGLRPAVENVLGYSQISQGDVEVGAATLTAALEHAETSGNSRIASYATFNLAIADELRGDFVGAAGRLNLVAEGCTGTAGDLLQWCQLRLQWLGNLSDELDVPVSRRTVRVVGSPAVATSWAQLAAVQAALSGHLTLARQQLRSQVVCWHASGDSMNEFVTLLWLSVVEHRSSRDRAARRAIREARAISERSGLRLATSWWHPELVQVARTVAETDDRDWAQSLILTAACSPARAPRVQIRRDGSAVVDGVARPQDIWREGRTGSRVLRRYFQLLLERSPRCWQRDELADALWPESEGDRAIRNLHAATYDLRRVLAEIPGARLSVADGRYELQLGASVSVE
jgi:tetratricopeptide (TPR) repeat protein